MLKGRKELAIISIFVLSVFSNALLNSNSLTESVTVDQNEEVIVYAIPYDFGEQSVFKTSSYATALWTSSVFAGLLKRTSNYEHRWVPNLVEDYPERSSNGLVYTFTLRDNLNASNGERITSEDIQFSLQKIFDESVSSSLKNAYDGVLDGDSISVISDTMFSITLLEEQNYPYSFFSFPIIAKDAYPSEFGTGPFMLTDFDDVNDVVTVEANPYYHNAGNMRTDKIIFKKISTVSDARLSFNNGSVDIIDPQYFTSLTLTDELIGGESEVFGASITNYMALNHLHPWFGTGDAISDMNGLTGSNYTASKLLRKAISHVIDRETIISDILNGMGSPAAAVVPSGTIGWDNNLTPDVFNIDTAKQIMEDIGFDFASLGATDVNGLYESFFFNVTILSSNTNPSRNDWTNFIASYLPKIGIGVTTTILTGWAEIIPRTFGSSTNPPVYNEGGYDIFMTLAFLDLDWDFGNAYLAEGNCLDGDCANFYNFDLEETITPFAAKIEEYFAENEFDARYDHLSHIQELEQEWLPVIPIFHGQYVIAYSEDLVGIDAVLLHNTKQEWDKVYITGFQLNNGSTITEWSPPPLTTPNSENSSEKPDNSDGPSPVNFGAPFFFLGIITIILGKKKEVHK